MTAAGAVPKYFELSIKLEGLIREGEWAVEGRTPGLRVIAERFGVSTVTASRALQLLQERGLVKTLDRSGSYLATTQRPVENEKWGLFLRVTPGMWRQSGLDVMREGFHAALKGEQIELATDLFPIDSEQNRDDWRRNIRRAKQAGIKGTFFLPSRLDEANARRDVEFLETCREEEFPVVMIERSIRGRDRRLDCDLVCADNLEAGRLCTQHLLDIGRRRIALVVASPTSTHLDRAAGYLHALHQAGVNASRIVELPADLPGREAYGWSSDQLQEFNADGVICYHDYNAVGLVLELLQRGIRVPHDLAVIGFENYPIGNMFSLGLTTVSYPMPMFAWHALRLLRDRARGWKGSPIKLLIPVDLTIRESTLQKAPKSSRKRS